PRWSGSRTTSTWSKAGRSAAKGRVSTSPTSCARSSATPSWAPEPDGGLRPPRRLVPLGIRRRRMGSLGHHGVPHPRLHHQPLLRRARRGLEPARRLYRPVLARSPHLRRRRRLHLGAAPAAWESVHSRFGVFMRAIRDDEEAAAAMGVDTFKWKRVAFVVSAVFAAVAGGFQGHYIGLLSPAPMKFNEMATIVIMVIVGGLRTFFGPILGAVFIEVLSELLRGWGEVRMVLFALLVIALARLYTRGLGGPRAPAAPRAATPTPPAAWPSRSTPLPAAWIAARFWAAPRNARPSHVCLTMREKSVKRTIAATRATTRLPEIGSVPSVVARA